jgi:hypothetical protein
LPFTAAVSEEAVDTVRAVETPVDKNDLREKLALAMVT